MICKVRQWVSKLQNKQGSNIQQLTENARNLSVRRQITPGQATDDSREFEITIYCKLRAGEGLKTVSDIS